MRDDVLQIDVPSPEGWIERLTALDGVKDAALFGTSIHAVVSDATRAQDAMKNMFENEKIKDYRINKIQASLEDVFVALIEAYDKKANDESKKN
jgi:ABC-2 type transport system ATP-binding protein